MKVLLIEDEPRISSLMKKFLQAENFVVDLAHDGSSGSKLAVLNTYDAVILDFYLPQQTGIEVAEYIRERNKSLPIIVHTVELNLEKKIKMLSLCDDYVTKPCPLKELCARLRALKRRGKSLYGNVLESNNIRLDLTNHKVTYAGEEVKLRSKEFSLLEYFLRNRDTVLSRTMILENVWDMNVDPFTNTVDVHVRFLRRKISPGIIQTISKKGYKFID